MPSLSPPPTNRVPLSQPTLAQPVTSKTTFHTLSGQTSNSNSRDSDADAKLRDRGDSPSIQAFGGKRRAGKVGLGMKPREWTILVALTVLGSFIRMYRLGWPTSVV